MVENPWILPGAEPFATLPDNTPLYKAYWPLEGQERYRREIGWWDGAVGYWIGATLGGKTYQQPRLWGNSIPDPDWWKEIMLGWAPGKPLPRGGSFLFPLGA